MLLTACSNSKADVEIYQTELSAPIEDSPKVLYSETELILEKDVDYGCKRENLPRGWCQFHGNVYNNGVKPIDFLAEIWAEDSEGKTYISEEVFEDRINPGLTGRVYFRFVFPINIHVVKVYLVDISGPISDVILSANVNLYI